MLLGLGASLAFATAASAQQATDPVLAPQRGPAWPGTAASAAASSSGPLVYLCDDAGRLGTLNLKTKAVHVIGNIGVVLTDIAFAPGGTLYGVSFTDFYKVSTTTGKATRIGSLGTDGINALAFDKAGNAVAASVKRSGFYGIDLATGRATSAGLDGGFLSAGDFAYSGSHLYFSTSSQQLVDFDLSGHTSRALADHINQLYGLAVTAPGRLYGFANTTLYKLDPSTGKEPGIANSAGTGSARCSGRRSRSCSEMLFRQR